MAHVGKIKVRVEIVHSDERERWQAVNALLSEQLEEARRWHLTAVNEKRAAQADAERLFTALDGYIMARITGTDLRDYDDLAERAARAHRALATDVPGKLDRTVLDPETGIEEPVTTGRIPDAEFVEPPLMPPAASPDSPDDRESLIAAEFFAAGMRAASPDERLREAAAWLVELAAAAVCEPRRFAENETELQWKTADAITATRAALAAADRDKEARDV